ncbi:dihydroxyacetone kinase subunit DhaK [Defluviitalea phaphyphila]|uniref:dihydroxyacetone kinase subunit DhaK n=1 Tax=Defluviitalea phaphyphila TaxID=1473580 RepID=UPI0007308A9E|nr:dihydroxyacetone kinase subunit DhaK [Defluviitalea phaphyphila]
MKKIINDKKNLLTDMLSGYAKSHKDRVVLEGNILYRKNKKDPKKVAVIIGNGSGHEPAMIDLVGEGLFDANVCGQIFTAPSSVEMIKAVKKLHDYGHKDILILVSSHEGDILNAKMTLMLAKAEGIEPKMVVLWDDVSSAPKGMETERRGSAGLFFPFKVVCGAAEDGMNIDDLIRLAEKVRDNTRALSTAISGGTNPETGLKMFELPEDEIEVGMGVHGESGAHRMKLPTAHELVEYMLDIIVEDKPFVKGDDVLVLVNNAGSLTYLELYTIYDEIEKYLNKRGINVVRNWVGTYVTTQEMAGFSIALCKSDDEILKYYDYKADGPLFR